MKNKNSGFTLIELIITIGCVVIVLGGFYLLSVYSYRQFIKIHHLCQMKMDAANIKALIESDIARGGKVAINSDNHGITININGKKKSYLYKNNTIIRTVDKTEGILTKYYVCDGVWIIDNNIISMNIEFSYKNLNTGEINYLKIIKDIDPAR
ncbi:MAG TPA: prepilin-type N-terminal cleavage/methylation domain-containing protein [Candidatus Eremiobacteraeota bacterium]|nr:prepilin-type N-terminal cleavage/methylation domain-containing protein [Candidatus Eremiobacteraeota bacterium]